MKNYHFIFIALCLLSMQVSAQSVLRMTGGKVKIKGNAGIVLKNSSWANNGGQLVTDSGTVVFTGSLSDTIGGSTQTTFGRVIMNKTGGNVQVNTATEISDSLALSQGLMILEDQNLRMLSGGRTSTGSNQSYVKTSGTGTMIQEVGTDSVFFPIGGIAYRPAIMNNSGASDFFLVRVSDSVLEQGATGPRVTQQGIDATWHIGEEAKGGSVIGLTLQWNETDEQNGFIRNDAYISRYAQPWDVVSPENIVGSDPYRTGRSGLTNVGLFTLFNQDEDDPVITCPANIVRSNDLDACDAVVTYQVPVGTDNVFGAVTVLSSGLGSGSAFPIGVNVETYTVTDRSGNSTSCSFTITVIDTVIPTIICPPDFTLSNDQEACGAVLDYSIGTSDNCPNETLQQLNGLTANSEFPIGTMVNTFEVTDVNGNTANCSFTVTVNDVDNPVFVCPTSNVVRNTDLGMCDHLAVGQDLDPAVSDNCAIQSLINDYNQSSSLDGAVFPKGKTLVNWIASDPSGNSTICAYEIKIRDKEAPTFDNCPADTTITIPFNTGGSYYTWSALTATDNCNSPGQLTLTGFPLSGSFFSVGTMTVNWTATDKKNNTSTCDFDVTVVEQGAPAPSGWTVGGIGSSNNCQTNYDAATGTATIVTSGGMINTTSDQFCSITFPTSDQVIDFRARVTPPGSGYYDQAGIMMRQSLTANSANAAMYLTGTGVPIMALRASAGTMPLSTAGTAVTTPYWVRLYRYGGVILGYISADGVNWSLVKSYPNLISSPLYLVVFSKTSGTQGTATIDQISINGTAAREGLMTRETELSLRAYPNPFSEDLFIDVDNALPGENYQVRLSNMMGQRVYGYETGASPEGTIDQRISLEHLAAGTYLLEVSAGVQRKTLKVVKQ